MRVGFRSGNRYSLDVQIMAYTWQKRRVGIPAAHSRRSGKPSTQDYNQTRYRGPMLCDAGVAAGLAAGLTVSCASLLLLLLSRRHRCHHESFQAGCKRRNLSEGKRAGASQGKKKNLFPLFSLDKTVTLRFVRHFVRPRTFE